MAGRGQPHHIGRTFELRHLPALDGLRGLAVAGVLLYHAGHLEGGYLGVDLFFVLSGFLITALLLREVASHGGVNLRAFWIRRARRLLPAMFGVLVGVTVYAVVWATRFELGALRTDTLATLGYVANWRAIAAGSGYWDNFTVPSPLQHTWSLAVEEQFYLLWPLVLAAVAAACRRSGRSLAPRMAALTTAGALASWVWMAARYTPGEDPSRLYFGTDTRAGSILAGAALAAGLSSWGWGRVRASRPPWAWSPGRTVLEVAAVGAAALLTVMWVALDGQSPLLYRGGFVVSGLAVVTLIAAAAHPTRGPVARALSWSPLRALGLLSYGLYLWHWPVFVVLELEKSRLHVDGLTLLAVKLAVSLAFALGSYHLIERRIRHRGFLAWGPLGRTLMPVAAAVSVVLVLAATMGAEPLPESASGPLSAGTGAPAQTVPEVTDPAGTEPGLVPPPAVDPRQPVTGPLARPQGRDPRVMIVGDSVAFYLGAGLEAEQKSLHLKAVNQGVIACSLPRAGAQWRHGDGKVSAENPACRQWERRWSEGVNRFKPDAVVFLYGGPLSGELKVNGQWAAPCSQEFLSYWRQETEAAMEILTARGAVLYLAPAPYTRFPFMPRTIDDNIDCVSGVYRDIAIAHPDRVRILGLDKWVCPDADHCLDKVDGEVLREDGVHFFGSGGKAAARWIGPQLFEPVAPTARP